MKFWTLLICLLTHFFSNAQDTYLDEIKAHREGINEEFADSENTILDSADWVNFNGLEFFEINPEYRVLAKFKKIKKGEIIGFSTSTDRIAKYREYGTLTFKINGEKCKLTVYEPAVFNAQYPDHLFLPFKDFSNGVSSYGGGRYLDLSKKDISKKMFVDFNYCYNPYCAYSGNYSCPVPPSCNYLEVEILAGVKAFGQHH